MIYLAALWIIAILTLGAWLGYEMWQDKRYRDSYEPRASHRGRMPPLD